MKKTPKPQVRYPLASGSWGPEESAAIHRTMARNIYTMGEAVYKLEREFSQWVGSKYCVMVNSGSSANLLMIAAMFFRNKNGLQKGDEVIVPAVSWATTYYPISQYGMKLRFVDIDPETLNYNLDKLTDAITPNTRVILAVNLLGNPNDFNKIINIIADRNIVLLEDNCESLGAVFEGKQTGTWGLMGTYSSFFSHHISTMEGGYIVTDDEELYLLLKSLRAHGWTRELPDTNIVSGNKSKDPFEELFKFVLPGYNVRPLEMSGMIGQEQLKKLSGFVETRRKNAIYFHSLFCDHEHFQIQREIGQSSWFGFALIIRKGSPLHRRDVVNTLISSGIECRPIVGGNFTKNPVMKWLDYTIHDTLDAANHLDEHGFFVGNQEADLREPISYLKEVLNAF